MEHYILEACVDSVESAIHAARGGANRLELCSNLMIGGTTPTKALYDAVRKNTNIRVNVLIRPRFGDFCYSDYELEMIKEEIRLFGRLGADGIVVGALKPDGTLDIEQMERFLEAAGTMQVTLHRASDVLRDPFEALKQAEKLGIGTILTSGQKNTALEGVDCLKRLKEKSEGKVDILIGSGVNSSVIPKLYEQTKATSYHMSGKQMIKSRMEYRKQDVHMGLDAFSEYEIWQTDEEEIRLAAEILKNL